MTYRILAGALFLLSACVAPEGSNTPGNSAQPGDLIPGKSDGGLIEREPDLCDAANYQQYVGQAGTIVPSLSITRPYRVIRHGDIFTQEYNAGRLNFWLTPSGSISRVVCG